MFTGGRHMASDPKYYLVEASALPKVFISVAKVNRYIKTGKAKTVNEAVSLAGISRSVYYKYKDSITPFYEMAMQRVITVYAVLKDEPGVLSNIINALYKSGANILTINQNIPLAGEAGVTMTLETGELTVPFETFVKRAKGVDGVLDLKIMARG
jgi:chorismate mutase